MIRVRFLSAAAIALAGYLPAMAHEFWVEPHQTAIASTHSLNADLRNGEFFAGPNIPYIAGIIERFEVLSGDRVLPVQSRLGNRPAIKDMALPDGLAVVVFQSTTSRLNYETLEDFAAFVEHKDLTGTLASHRDRGLPDADFDENYRRYSKALVAVGDGRGSDRQVGLLIEIVALANPYTDDLSDGMPLRVFYDGQPRADVQLELFERAPDDSVAIATYRTDADGRVVVPVQPGHIYLADSVAIRPLDPPSDNGAVWHTDWAALTFAVPQD